MLLFGPGPYGPAVNPNLTPPGAPPSISEPHQGSRCGTSAGNEVLPRTHPWGGARRRAARRRGRHPWIAGASPHHATALAMGAQAPRGRGRTRRHGHHRASAEPTKDFVSRLAAR